MNRMKSFKTQLKSRKDIIKFIINNKRAKFDLNANRRNKFSLTNFVNSLKMN